MGDPLNDWAKGATAPPDPKALAFYNKAKSGGGIGGFFHGLKHAAGYAVHHPLDPLEALVGAPQGSLQATLQHPLNRIEHKGQFATGAKFGAPLPTYVAKPPKGKLYRKVGPNKYEVPGISSGFAPMPFGRGLANIEELLGVKVKGLVPRTPEAAQAHLNEAIGKAKSEGYFHPAQIPVVKGEPVQAGAELQAQFRKDLAGQKAVTAQAKKAFREYRTSHRDKYGTEKGAPKPLTYEKFKQAHPELSTEGTSFRPSVESVQNQQEALRSAERSKRVAKGAQAQESADTAMQGHFAAKAALKGMYPELKFSNATHFDQQDVESLMKHVADHPSLQFFERVRAQNAVLKVTQGGLPTKSEKLLLDRAFGIEGADQLVKSVPFFKHAKRLALEIINVPRAIMASFDISAPFRQGLVVASSHPKVFFKNFAPMMKALKSEDVFQTSQENIRQMESHPLALKGGVDYTDIGTSKKAGAADLSRREEQFNSNLAERYIPGIRQSDRAYVGFLNKTRSDLFDTLVRQAAENGDDLTDATVLEGIAKFVNSATGRGNLGAFQKHAVTLNTLLFSPKLLASRLNFLNPLYYNSLSGTARLEALRAIRNLVGSIGLTLEVAKLAGASVETDPRSANWAKIRIGNTRIDIAGGFQQPLRAMAQMFLGESINSSTGEVTKAKPGFAGHTAFAGNVLWNFFTGKLAPVPSIALDYGRGRTFNYQTPTLKNETLSHFTPLLTQDVAQLYKQGGVPAALAGYAVGAVGFGLQTYKQPKSKKKARNQSITGDPLSGWGGSSGGSVSGDPLDNWGK